MLVPCIIVSIIIVVIVLIITYLSYRNSDLRKRNKDLEEKNKKTLHQRKSSEVRLGKIGENMAPFFNEWPYEPNNFRFLGNPVDGISFNEDEVVFVEIKTGKARLTNSQKSVKKLVKEGKVSFATFRVSEDGCELKVDEVTDPGVPIPAGTIYKK